MIKLKKTLFGLSAVFIFLLTFGIANAAVTGNGGNIQVDTTTLTDSTNFVEQITGNHNTQVTGTFNITGVGSGSYNVTAITPTDLTLTVGTQTYTIPASAFSFAPATPTVTAGTSQEITYTITIPNLQYAGTYTGASAGADITVVNDGSLGLTPGFDMEVTVNPYHAISIVQSSISKSAILGNSATYNVTLSNVGNIDEQVTCGLSEFDLNWKKAQKLATVPTVSCGTVASNSTSSILFTLGSDIISDKYGSYSGIFNITAGTTTDNLALIFTTQRSDDDNIADLENYGVDDDTGSNDEWRPGDKIVIDSLELWNQASTYVLKDVDLKATLYRVSNGKNYASEKINIDDIDEGDSVEENVEIQIPYDAPAGDYILELYMTSENQDNSAEKHTDVVYSELINVIRDSRHVIVKDLSISGSELMCGDEVQISVDIANIGKKDMDKDDNIQLRLESDALGWNDLKTQIEIKEDEEESFTYDLTIPADKKKGTYILTASLTYDNDDGDDGTSASSSVVLGDCSPDSANSDGSASGTAGQVLVSGSESGAGSAGEAIKYTLTVSNSGDSIADYTIDVTGVSDWATVTTEPTGTLRLAAGQSATVFVYLTPNLDTSGTNTATVNVKSNGVNVGTKTINAAVSSNGASITTFTRSTLSDIGSGNAMLIGSAVVNLLLIMTMIGLVYKMKQEPNGRSKLKSQKGSKRWD